jgi:glutathione S-transferase
MAKLKILGRKTSSNVQKVVWTCAELGVAYDRVDIGGPFGGNDDPAYRALNPMGLVPTLQDGDFVLWESNSIMRYIERKFGDGTLYPRDLRGAASVERWMDWHNGHLGPAITPIFLGFIRTPPEKRDMAAIEAARQRTAGLLRMLDAHLAGKAYLEGDRFSLADIPAAIQVYRWHVLPVERPALPNLEAWYARMQERPAFKTHVMFPLV